MSGNHGGAVNGKKREGTRRRRRSLIVERSYCPDPGRAVEALRKLLEERQAAGPAEPPCPVST